MQRIKFDMGELIAFVVTAEKASFRHAADALFLSPPALSRRVERLEAAVEHACWNAPPGTWN